MDNTKKMQIENELLRHRKLINYLMVGFGTNTKTPAITGAYLFFAFRTISPKTGKPVFVGLALTTDEFASDQDYPDADEDPIRAKSFVLIDILCVGVNKTDIPTVEGTKDYDFTQFEACFVYSKSSFITIYKSRSGELYKPYRPLYSDLNAQRRYLEYLDEPGVPDVSYLYYTDFYGVPTDRFNINDVGPYSTIAFESVRLENYFLLETITENRSHINVTTATGLVTLTDVTLVTEKYVLDFVFVKGNFELPLRLQDSQRVFVSGTRSNGTPFSETYPYEPLSPGPTPSGHITSENFSRLRLTA